MKNIIDSHKSKEDINKEFAQNLWVACCSPKEYDEEQLIELIDYYINFGADINYVDEKDNAIIANPILTNRPRVSLHIAKQLDNVNTYVYKEDGENSTILDLATLFGDVELVKYLFSRGAQFDLTHGKYSVLHNSSSLNVEILEEYYKHGANINIQGKYGETPLHFAAFDNNVGLVKKLLELGANPNIKTWGDISSNRNEVTTKSSNGTMNIMLPSIFRFSGETALKCAIKFKSYASAEIILEHPSTDLSVKDDDGLTILEWSHKRFENNTRDIGLHVIKYNIENKMQEQNSNTKKLIKSQEPQL